MRTTILALVLLGFCFLSPATLSVHAGANPADTGLARSTAFGVPTDNNYASAMCVDCHSLGPVRIDNTAKGSHFVYRDTLPAHATRNTATWEKTTAWDNTTFSKYGNSALTPNKPAGTAGEMICESCHNMLRNTGLNKLLAIDNTMTDPSGLCLGCHVKGTFGGHHPMTGDPVNTRGNQTLSTTAGSAYATPLDGATYPGTDRLNCRSCHAPHGAQTTTGARVLKKGIGTGVTGAAINRSGHPEVDRQWDIDATSPPATRLVKDAAPLCGCCHAE